MPSERELLLGTLAVQLGWLTADQLAEAALASSSTKPASLADRLIAQKCLQPEDLAHLEYLADRQLAQTGGDLRQTLAHTSTDLRGILSTISQGPSTDTWESARATLGYAASVAGTDAANPTTEPPRERYRLNTLHAAGGIGEIWLAQDLALEREVAVKRLQSKQAVSNLAKLRFLREARITSQLDHPGVVPIYEICLDPVTHEPYYSMRFLRGRTLSEDIRQYHARRGTAGGDYQALLALLNAFCIVCNTVGYAHWRGVVHRDLKSENVILGDYGEVVVIDWGLAKKLDARESDALGPDEPPERATENPLATLAGHILGSPAYMAPEQAAGKHDQIGPATDIYGLSAVLYEILTGRPPFVASTLTEVLVQVQYRPPQPPTQLVPGIPEALEQICLKGLAKSPAERFASAEQLAQAITRWIGELAQRRQAEEERERFFALSWDLLAIVDRQGELRQVSPAWQRLLGYGRDELLGRSFLEFIEPLDRPVIEPCLALTELPDRGAARETRVLHCDGSTLWVSWNVTAIAQEQCVYLVGRDVTELKRSQRLFQGILHSAPDALVLINSQGQIVLANEQTERLFGYEPSELVGQPIEVLVPEDVRPAHPAHVAGFFARSSVRPMGSGLLLRGQHKSGRQFRAEISLSPIVTDQGKLVAASVREVSDHR